jgi:hypothetical protein
VLLCKDSNVKIKKDMTVACTRKGKDMLKLCINLPKHRLTKAGIRYGSTFPTLHTVQTSSISMILKRHYFLLLGFSSVQLQSASLT